MSASFDDAPHLWDLGSQLGADEVSEADATAVELRLIDRARVTLAERLRGARGQGISWRTIGGESMPGKVSAVFDDVVLLEGDHTWIVSIPAIEQVRGLPLRRLALAQGRERGSGRPLLLELFDTHVLVGRTTGVVSAGCLCEIGGDYLELADPTAGSTVIGWSAVAWVRAHG